MALVGANVAVAKLLAEALPIPLIACLRCALACLVLWPLARTLEGRVRVGGAALRNLARQWAAAALAAGGMAAITVARLGGEAGGSALGNALVFCGVCGEATYVLL